MDFEPRHCTASAENLSFHMNGDKKINPNFTVSTFYLTLLPGNYITLIDFIYIYHYGKESKQLNYVDMHPSL